jgi:hypothetical protein
MNAASGHRRVRVSIRMMMIVVALCALFLAPVGWFVRLNEKLVRAERMAADRARAQAVLAQALSTQTGLTRTKAGSAVQPNGGDLWAGLGVNHCIFRVGQTKDLRIELALFNDGPTAIDPKIAESRIMINGVELTDSGSMLGRGLKDAQLRALAPGDNLQFAVPLAGHFSAPGHAPGVYRVFWKGSGFQSPAVVFRVLPADAR